MARPRVIDDERLLAGAAHVLAEVGPAAFTLARAARAIGVSPATYVKRFGSKQGLFLALNHRWVETIEPGLAAAVDGLTGADRVREAALWGMAEMDVPTRAANMLATLALDLADPEMQATLDQGWATQRQHLARLIDDAVHAGALPRAPEPEQAAQMLLALVEGARIAWCVRPEGSLAQRVRTHIDALLAAWSVGQT